MKFFTRAHYDDRHEGSSLVGTDEVTAWEPVPDADMSAMDVAIEELGVNGGFIFGQNGVWAKFVAPAPK